MCTLRIRAGNICTQNIMHYMTLLSLLNNAHLGLDLTFQYLLTALLLLSELTAADSTEFDSIILRPNSQFAADRIGNLCETF